jgi:hypothetical protein
MYNLAVILIAGLQCIPSRICGTGVRRVSIRSLLGLDFRKFLIYPSTVRIIRGSPDSLSLRIVNVVTDVAILALSVKPVLGLHLKLSRKLQVLGMFLTGGV